jgi:heat shock protein HslJ
MDVMTRTRTGLLAAAFTATLLAVSAVPAMAGDSPAAAGSVVGDWRTSTDGVKQTITFDSKGRVFGDSGCNRFTGGYTVKGSKIEIGPLASTMMFCEGRMDAEAAFLKTLQKAKTFTATDTVLKIYTKNDVLRLKAA